MAQQIESALAKFPERRAYFISGPTVIGRSGNGGGIVVTCKVAFEFSNAHKKVQIKAAYQLTIEDNGSQLFITGNSPQILERHGSI